ncbi:hypothetical protein PUR71_09475 [Streptomyces sp. SP17BM10]|nr:hypothetical protein [Streptomyces sp. SP17BM10]MEE1783143.1 hypothetical protein [Streptomyces sp. SP17BM10]
MPAARSRLAGSLRKLLLGALVLGLAGTGTAGTALAQGERQSGPAS